MDNQAQMAVVGYNSLDNLAKQRALREWSNHPCYKHFILGDQADSVKKKADATETIITQATPKDYFMMTLREQMIGEVRGLRYTHDCVVGELAMLDVFLKEKDRKDARNDAIGPDPTV